MSAAVMSLATGRSRSVHIERVPSIKSIKKIPVDHDELRSSEAFRYSLGENDAENTLFKLTLLGSFG